MGKGIDTRYHSTLRASAVIIRRGVRLTGLSGRGRLRCFVKRSRIGLGPTLDRYTATWSPFRSSPVSFDSTTTLMETKPPRKNGCAPRVKSRQRNKRRRWAIKRVLRVLEEFWFGEAPAERLAMLRILIGMFAFCLVASNYFMWSAIGYT